MAVLKIHIYPNPCLMKKAKEVVKVTNAERKILADMAETMYINKGVGLAATQVGIDKQLAVIDVGNGLVKLINPTIVKREGLEIQEEGCLSIPSVAVNVKRAQKVVLDFLTEDGEIFRLTADGLFARAIQHELDHLCGRLIIDYLGPVKKAVLKNKASKSLTKS
jgi:peptide deformylase